MKKITYGIFLFFCLFSYQLSAQIYTEDFESGLGTYENAVGNDVDWEVNTSLYQDGLQSISNAYGSSNDNGIFQSISLDLTTANNPQLSFWHIAKTEGGWDEAIVEISTDGGTTFTPFAIEDYSGGGVLEAPGIFDEDSYADWGTSDSAPTNAWWKREFFDLSDYITDAVVIRFRLTSDGSANRAGWFIDNIQINEVTCPTPSDIVVDNIMANSADISWTIGNSETEWEIVYGIDGFDPNTEGDTVVDNDGVLGESISSLNSSSDYDVYVRAICGAGDESEFAGPFSFSTACDVISLPWSEDFSSSTTPNCWEEAGDAAWDYSLNADYAAQDVEDHTAGGGTNYAWLDGSDNDDGNSSSLTSPFIDVSTLAQPALEFYLFSNNTDDEAINTVEVEFYDGAAWNSVLSVNNLLGEDWFQYVIDLSPYTITGAVQVKFTITGQANGGFTFSNDILLDDVTFIEMPACTNPIASYSVVGNCIDGPEFFVEVDLTNMGGSDDVVITDNQTPAESQTVSAIGVYQFGPYDNGTDVIITLENSLDSNCSTVSSALTQEFCTETFIDCVNDGPLDVNYCYGNDEDYEVTYVSTDGTPLNLTLNGGFLESCCDELIVLDTDGTELFNSGGDISGNTFQSTGAEITVIISSDGSVNCGGNDYDPIDYTVSCATCVNPQVAFEVVGDCINGPQFFVEVDIADLGSSAGLTLTDNQTPAQTIPATAIDVYNFGPYPNGTDVIITVANDDDANCTLTSSELTQELCTDTFIDCTTDGPLDVTYCYDNNENYEVTYVSIDGTVLNLTVNSGIVENNYDEFIVLDSDGTTELYNGYGNAGDLTGLTFQSTGAEITIRITPDISNSCESNGGVNPLDYTVSCATCVNPQVNFEVVADCDVDPQFLIDVEITDLGSATELLLSDGDVANDQTIDAVGTYTFGPYPNGDLMNISVLNTGDNNCEINSGELTQEYCSALNVDCAVGPENSVFCYDDDETVEIVYTSTDGTVLNLMVNSGQMATFGDSFVILDSDGSELYNGTGNAGDLSGINFQSTGDNITVQLISNGFTSCQSNDYTPVDITVACATCVSPEVNFEVVADCNVDPQFLIDVEITDLGSATELLLSDGDATNDQTVDAIGTYTFGPYLNGDLINISVLNTGDNNCEINSQGLTQEYCSTLNVDCSEEPENTVFCYDSNETVEIVYTSTDGGPLNLIVNSGDIYTFGGDFVVTDTDGSVLYTGTGVDGDLSGIFVQSTGDQITVTYNAGFYACGESTYTEIDLTVTCATCVNPQVEYFKECDPTNQEYSISVEVIDLGSAGSVEITDDQGSTPEVLTTLGTVTFGPYSYDTDVVITTQNLDDVSCTIVSPIISSDSCPPIPCLEAEPFCSSEGLLFENVDDTSNTTAPPGIDYGCLFTQPNPVWYFLQIDEPGDLSIDIVQNTSFDNNGNPNGAGLDVDFIAWGPFDSVESACNGLTIQNQVADNAFGDGCSYSIDAEETLGLENAQEGEVYVLLITNYDGAAGFISLNQSGGDGSTDCSIIDENTTYACSDDPVTLTSQYPTALAYVWYFQNTSGGFDEITGETNMSITVNEGGIYRLDTFNNEGELQQEIFTVIFSEGPDLSSVNDTVSFCGSTSATIDATIANPGAFDAVTYQWSDENGPIVGEDQAILSVSEAGMYTVMVSGVILDNDGNPTSQTCDTSKTIEVTTADFAVDAGDDQSACDVNDFTLTATIVDGDITNAVYEWLDSSGNVVGTTETIIVTESDIYTVTVTIDGCSNSDDVEVVFGQSPDLSNVITADSFCEGTDVTLDGTINNENVFGTITYEWSDENGPIAGADQSTYTATVEGQYTVTVAGTIIDGSGNETAFTCSSSQTIQVNEIIFTVDAGSDQDICVNTTDLTAVVAGEDATNATYEWIDSAGNNVGNTATVSVSDSDTYEVTVTIDGCSVSDSVILDFIETPIIDLGSDVVTCDIGGVVIDATPVMGTSGVTFEWTYEGSPIAETGAVVNAVDYGFGTYTVEAYIDASCPTMETIEINQADYTVSLTSDQEMVETVLNYCSEEESVPSYSITFTANVEGLDASLVSYQWYKNGSLIIDAADASTYTATYSEDVDVMDSYSVEVILDNCSEQSEALGVDLTIAPYEAGCLITEGLSPDNRDGLNDCLDLTFLSDRSGISKIQIFNRYGRVVYEKGNYVSDWCGQDKDGDLLNTATYFYVIEFSSEDPVFGKVKKGWIYLNRESN